MFPSGRLVNVDSRIPLENLALEEMELVMTSWRTESGMPCLPTQFWSAMMVTRTSVWLGKSDLAPALVARSTRARERPTKDLIWYSVTQLDSPPTWESRDKNSLEIHFPEDYPVT